MADLWDTLTAEPVPDVEQDATDPAPAATPEFTCEVCGVPVVYSGRGRHPKRCDEHKRRTREPSLRAGPRGGARVEARLARIEEDLSKQGRQVGLAIGKWVPVTGLVFVTRSDKFSNAVCRLAAAHPEWIDSLEKFTQAAPVFDMAEFVAAVVFALGVDMGRVDPEGTMPRVLGITELWAEYEGGTVLDGTAVPEQPTGEYVGTTAVRPAQFGRGPMPPPPEYTPVGVGAE